MKATFEKTVDILVQAYLNDMLKHGDCSSCVVGNLCGGSEIWAGLFMTEEGTNIRSKRNYGPLTINVLGFRSLHELLLAATDICLSTGYSINQLSDLEHAFETAPKGDSKDDYMFNGIMAVIDVLAEIHNIDLKVKESAKLLFVKA